MARSSSAQNACKWILAVLTLWSMVSLIIIVVWVTWPPKASIEQCQAEQQALIEKMEGAKVVKEKEQSILNSTLKLSFENQTELQEELEIILESEREINASLTEILQRQMILKQNETALENNSILLQSKHHRLSSELAQQQDLIETLWVNLSSGAHHLDSCEALRVAANSQQMAAESQRKACQSTASYLAKQRPSKQNRPQFCHCVETSIATGMSSSDDNFTSHRRRNPHRNCRPIVEEPDKSYTSSSVDKVSALHSNKNKKTADLHPAISRGLCKTRKDKQRPEAVSRIASPERCLNGHLSPNSHVTELKKRPKPKFPAKTTKRSRKGRTKSDVEPCEKGDVPSSDDVACFERLENSDPAASSESQKTAKTKRTCSRPPKNVSPGLSTCTALTPQKQKISRHTKNDQSPSQHTPKRLNVQPRPLLSSTPNLNTLNRADSSCSPCHQDDSQSSPVKLSSPDVKPLRKCKTQRLLAAERPVGRKKRIVQERPGSSCPPKHSRKSESLLTESPPKEPSVETLPTSRTDELADPSMSSDLSIELSLQEELQPFYHSLSLQEEDQDNEEEELPSFLQDNKRCGSFVGSLIEYCAADISCPVRRKYIEGTSVLTFPSQEILSEENHDFDNSEDIILAEHDDLSKKVLPDRAKAARNRANVHLVDFIVNRRKVENRLLAVINGDESSQWIRALRNPTRQWVDVYLEDEEQVDKVYSYLSEVCASSPHTNACLERIQADRISFILDVLLPEAIIHAIAGVHKLSLEKAEEKYRSGPCFSNRERQEFDMMIEQQMKLKEITLRRKQKE
ncbi:PWWP domain-containing protein MUM1L1 [Triplophysa tibetana]|uniref:PWWP domain-containing protein MUM1L1 n=1 Tax=Triplophysa tibetana TaxID=1572043 RepID=A0A5A9PBY6_9TELE|nr:PWWP domain-containing protein MUM1L1 [Triplophysa tibetana]